MLLYIVIFVQSAFLNLKGDNISFDAIFLTMTVVFCIIVLFLDINSRVFNAFLDNQKSATTMIFCYVVIFLYFVIFSIFIFLICYYWVFEGYNADLLKLDKFKEVNNLQDSVNEIKEQDRIPFILDDTNSQIQIYKNYMINSDIYSVLKTLNRQNKLVENYYNSVNSGFLVNLFDLYQQLSNLIVNIHSSINSYNANLVVQDRLKYLVFDYLDYYNNNILPVVFNFDNNEFEYSLVTDNYGNTIFNNFYINYLNKNLNILDSNRDVLFSFINNNNGSSFTVDLPNGVAINNTQYNIAVAYNNGNLYLYLSECPGFNVGNFQSFISGTTDFSGLFACVTSHDVSSVYFNSNLQSAVNVPANCFYNDLYNSLFYKNISTNMNMEFVNYNQYMPILVACNSNNKPQWIIQNENGVPICVINEVDGEFTIYFAVSDGACVMVTADNNGVLQSVIGGGIDSYILNVI